jgi:hypothetical protein
LLLTAGILVGDLGRFNFTVNLREGFEWEH